MKLSVVCSGYRVENFRKLYDSIKESFSQDFELVICGPYAPDWQEDNFIFIQDYGSPARCCQRALLSASGEWVSFAWDDGNYLPGALDRVYKTLTSHDGRIAVVGKFYEVVHSEKDRDWVAEAQRKDDLYYIKTHNEARSDNFPYNYVIFGPGMINRDDLMKIGGFDTRYETYAIALLDISVRLQLDGVQGLLEPEPVFTCGWSYGLPGHEAVMDAYNVNDKGMYQSKYRGSDFGDIVMSVDNWRNSPARWSRRFPDISVAMPTIRTELLRGLYYSIANSFSGSWELVLCGPNPIPPDLASKGNVKWIQSYRCPTACNQLAFLASCGEWVLSAADDATFFPGAMDEMWETLRQHDFDYKTIVSAKYFEGSASQGPENVMRQDVYYLLNTHAPLQPAMSPFDKSWKVINAPLISRKFLMEIGGWDCQLQTSGMSWIDFAMRAQNFGCNVIMQDNPVFALTHEPGYAGTHGPVHEAHNEHDLPYFNHIWLPENGGVKRAALPTDNWKQSDEKWGKRFQW